MPDTITDCSIKIHTKLVSPGLAWRIIAIYSLLVQVYKGGNLTLLTGILSGCGHNITRENNSSSTGRDTVVVLL